MNENYIRLASFGPNDGDFKSTDKTEIEEFNLEEIRGWTIDELNKIEKKIDYIIASFFNQEKNHEFTKIMLNSSIISIGAKMKILRNISSFDNKVISKIQSIASIRNAFAHIEITRSSVITIKNENGKLVGKVESVTSQLDIMNSSGDIKTKNVKNLIVEYKVLIEETNKYFESIKKPPVNTSL